MGKRILFALLLGIGSLNLAQGQQCITTHFSAMIIQGEAMGRGIIGDDLGLGFNMVYGIPIGRKMHFNLVASHLRYNVDYMIPSGENSTYYYGNGSHTSIGAGLMLFPFLKSNRAALYSPYRMYVAASGGMAFQSNETVEALNIPSGFQLHNGGKALPYGEFLLGVKIRMNPRTSVDLFAGGRTTMSDEIDGIIGTGDGFDIIGRIGIGICRSIR